MAASITPAPQRLVYLSVGLAVLLAFIGVKLLLHALHEHEVPFINGGENVAVPEIPISVSLGAIGVILGVTTGASLWKTRRDQRREIDPPTGVTETAGQRRGRQPQVLAPEPDRGR